MLFNSFHFLYFISVVVPVFYLLPQKFRQFFLLLASYYFYMCWNYSYVVLITFTTATSFFASLAIENTFNQRLKRIYLYSSIGASISILFFFKYYNFFITNINSAASTKFSLLNYLLPVGISFYTFETLSYTIDVYRGKLKAERKFWIYALFISFFPKLVAGPIERSENLLPQFHRSQKFTIDNFVQGTKYIIIGFFMKLVIADRLALYVDAIYSNIPNHHGITFWIATLSFSFQILCDFAGYSTIAKGVAKWLDYDLMLNFRRPYLAASFGDFWRRWHISLSSWFRDYVYIPLGGNRAGSGRRHLNNLVTFLISGFWHGANWTFIVWGALHGCFLSIENIFKVKKGYNSMVFRLAKTVFIFALVSFAWIFFRANTIADAITVIRSMANIDCDFFVDTVTLFYGFTGVAVLMLMDMYGENKGDDNVLQNSVLNLPVTILFSLLFLIILFIGVFNGGQFIYFQF